MRLRVHGFSLLELMIVIAIIVILALIALPGVPDKFVRDQIVDAVKVADIAKVPVALLVGHHCDDARQQRCRRIAGGRSDRQQLHQLGGGRVGCDPDHLRQPRQRQHPRQDADLAAGRDRSSPIVPVAWVCGNAEAPGNMTALGLNKTNLELKYLPINCRSSGPGNPVGN